MRPKPKHSPTPKTPPPLPPELAWMQHMTKRELRALVNLLSLPSPEPKVIENCILFLLAETRGISDGRIRALIARRLKHCSLHETHKNRLLQGILTRLSTGCFSEQFKDQLRLARFLDAKQLKETCQALLNDRRDHVRRYARWCLDH